MRVLIAIFYTTLLTVLSLLPGTVIEGLPFADRLSDKVAHIFAYGLYVGVLIWSIPAKKRTGIRRLMGLVAFCCLYGVLMEVLQGFIRYGTREFSVVDMVANTLGATCAAVLFLRIRIWR